MHQEFEAMKIYGTREAEIATSFVQSFTRNCGWSCRVLENDSKYVKKEKCEKKHDDIKQTIQNKYALTTYFS